MLVVVVLIIDNDNDNDNDNEHASFEISAACCKIKKRCSN